MYEVWRADMSGYSFADANLETCKRYCYKGCVVVETHRVVNGFEVSFRFRKPRLIFEFHRYARCLVLFGIYINWSMNYTDKPGKVVFKNP